MDNKRSHKLLNKLHKKPHRVEEKEAKQDNILKQEISRNIQRTEIKIELNKEEHEWTGNR